MKPFYWQGTTNFGDYLNSRIWPELLDGYLSNDDDIRLIGIGSLLKSSINLLAGKKVIFGTGSGYGTIPNAKDYKEWLFYFVRGPRTAACFNLPPEKSIVDGAWLIGLLPAYANYMNLKKEGTAFIPHWNTADTGNWENISKINEFNYINPLDDLDKILLKIATSELVITESLHGAILADLFRTPWIPISISPDFLSFKWIDWFESIGLNPQMTNLPLSDRFDYFYNRRNTRDINYSAEQHSIAYTPPLIENKPILNKKAGTIYKIRSNIKSALRNSRRNLLNGINTYRNSRIFSEWNTEHCAKVSQCLKTVSKQKPQLSSDSTRMQKLEMLQIAVNCLKKDYREILTN